MTWILGTGVPFGYGALIADVRVSWRNGLRLDVLQKIHEISPWMIAGFSGSVEFGFSAIGDLQHCFPEPPADKQFSYFGRAVAWKWYRRLRRAYTQAPLRVTQYPFSLLLASAEPNPKQPIPISRCIRMSSLSNPPFQPEFVPPFKWWSIGSGRTHVDAAYFANLDFDNFGNSWGKGEVGNRGGAAFTIAGSVARGLAKQPNPDVGGQLQVGCVFSGQYDIRTLEVEQYGPHWSSHRRVESSGLVKTWEEFEAIAASNNVTAGAAST
ncbi:MAG: hypothetical protein Q8O42_07560 [Acidobacteriota bacterium]|nr:hypothetical protein [Acidobacteriota bacterium]